MDFIGRKEELAKLETYFASDTVNTCAIFGRRRVGKTALISRFCDGKPSLKFNMAGSDRDKVLDHMAMDISSYTGEHWEDVRTRIRDFDDVLGFLGSLEPRERMVVSFDEFPDVVELFPDAAASLMRYIDGRMKSQKLFLIVCGSSISAMMRELNEGDRPLFQRFPVQLRVRPMPYRDARLFHPGLSEDDRVRMYAIASGIPLYHLLMSVYRTPEDAVKGLFLGPVATLYLEAKNVLALEVSPHATYDRVLSVMGSGSTDVKTISEKSGLSKTRCREVLDDLRVLDMVGVRSSYGSRGRKTQHYFRDGFLEFYYSVIAGNEALMDTDPDSAFRIIESRVNMFYGHRFEDVCAQYLKSNEPFLWCGRWWGKSPIRDDDGSLVRGPDGHVATEDTDVDVVVEVSRGSMRSVMMVECKFTRRQAGIRELDELKGYADQAKIGGENLEYVIFSRSGFTSSLQTLPCTVSMSVMG